MYVKLFNLEFFLSRRSISSFHMLKEGPGEWEFFAPGWNLIVSRRG